MESRYINKPVTEKELRDLQTFALEEEKDFFARNPHSVHSYKDRMVLIALCHGAALQYLGNGNGVESFDIFFFYQKNPKSPRISKAKKKEVKNVGDFKNMQINFMRTVIYPYLFEKNRNNIVKVIQDYLTGDITRNSSNISKGAVIGLYPEKYFQTVFWPQNLS
jgi:hypothetical protein